MKYKLMLLIAVLISVLVVVAGCGLTPGESLAGNARSTGSERVKLKAPQTNERVSSALQEVRGGCYSDADCASTKYCQGAKNAANPKYSKKGTCVKKDCPGGTVCDGSPAQGILNEVVCGTTLTSWKCTANGWEEVKDGTGKGAECTCAINKFPCYKNMDWTLVESKCIDTNKVVTVYFDPCTNMPLPPNETVTCDPKGYFPVGCSSACGLKLNAGFKCYKDIMCASNKCFKEDENMYWGKCLGLESGSACKESDECLGGYECKNNQCVVKTCVPGIISKCKGTSGSYTYEKGTQNADCTVDYEYPHKCYDSLCKDDVGCCFQKVETSTCVGNQRVDVGINVCDGSPIIKTNECEKGEGCIDFKFFKYAYLDPEQVASPNLKSRATCAYCDKYTCEYISGIPGIEEAFTNFTSKSCDKLDAGLWKEVSKVGCS